MRTFVTSRVLTCLVLALMLSAASRAGWGQSAGAPPDHAPGVVMPGPDNIRSFAPPESGVTVPAAQINLRALFEELGPDATLWYQHVQTLANPYFEGRAPGTRGIERAAEYLQFWFDYYGLEPAFPSELQEPGGEKVAAWTNYTQPFDFRAPNPDMKVIHAAAAINGNALQQGEEFTVLGVSANGTVKAPLTFVGYGLQDAQDGYSSFDEQTDLTGQIALLLRYEPLNDEGKSRWSQTRFSRQSALTGKLRNVAARGAAGIILVNPPGAVDGKTGLESLQESLRFGERLKVPVVQMTPEAANRLVALGDPEGRNLLVLRRLADDAQVKCVRFKPSVRASISAEMEGRDRLETRNVAGVLRGKGNLASQWIVIGAHYDHVGYGYTGARQQNVGKLHPGADDNASGTAGLLIAIKRLATEYDQSQEPNLRSIMFVAFSAEEAGLIGSKHFVEHAPIPAKSVMLMINMDMIGRLRDGSLSISGTGTAKGFEEILRPHFVASGMKISASPSGRGPSDHSSFFNAGIPVLFAFTGTHAEYHQPSDRAYTVNPAGAIQVIDLIQPIVMDLASRPEKLEYVMSTAGSPTGGPVSASRVRLGVQPAYNAEIETGVEVEAVSEGTAAAEGGVKAGDILLTWNGEEITGAQKLFELLGKHAPGDRVQLTVRRASQDHTLDITLKGRE